MALACLAGIGLFCVALFVGLAALTTWAIIAGVVCRGIW